MTINAPAEGVKLTGVNFSYVEGKAPVEGEVLNTCICEVRNAATDAHLNMLSLSAGTLHPAFDMAVFNYTLEVTPGQTSTNVIAETNEEDAKLLINGKPATKSSGPYALDAKTALHVEIVAPDPRFKLEYNVVVKGSDSE